MENEIKIVIGSWGSYNECNERALGSEWLTLNDFNTWDEIEAELIQEGFKLDGIDEELFIQDIEGIVDSSINWDCVNPETLFNTLDESGILRDKYKYEVFNAFIEVESFLEFEDRVEKYGDRWDDDITFYKDMTMSDVAYEIVNECYNLDKLMGNLANYFDYEAFARDLSFDGYTEASNGVICLY